jgi:AAA+ superfamily predicted ATPase
MQMDNEELQLTEVEEEIVANLRARCSILWIKTIEEQRSEIGVGNSAFSMGREVHCWDTATGLTTLSGEAVVIDEKIKNPQEIIARIMRDRTRTVFVLRDLHRWIDGRVCRALRSAARKLEEAPLDEARTIVILTPPSAEIPEELKGDVIVIEYPRPDRSEMSEILDGVLENVEDEIREKTDGNGTREEAVDAALGLTQKQAENVFAKSAVKVASIEPSLIATEKKKAIKLGQGIEYIDPDPRGMAAVAGLQRVKSFSALRRKALSQEARDYGLPAPRGIFLTGVSGCGKTLTAKSIASEWNVPLLRFSPADAQDKFVGGTEKNVREALALAETVAPSILWIDEIEKAVSGTSGPQGDGGVSTRALGTLLTWMQEKTAPVFVIATANDITNLPPELLRKGRFDELFFVDLPTAVERKGVLEVAIRKVGRDPKKVGNLDKVVAETEGWSGAELANLVMDALYAAYADNAREPTVADLEEQAKDVVPLSSTARETIDSLRDWAKSRCRPASDPEVKTKKRGRQIDLAS